MSSWRQQQWYDSPGHGRSNTQQQSPGYHNQNRRDMDREHHDGYASVSCASGRGRAEAQWQQPLDTQSVAQRAAQHKRPRSPSPVRQGPNIGPPPVVPQNNGPRQLVRPEYPCSNVAAEGLVIRGKPDLHRVLSRDGITFEREYSPTEDERQQRREVVGAVQSCVRRAVQRKILPASAMVGVFGSSTTGLDLWNSDTDMAILREYKQPPGVEGVGQMGLGPRGAGGWGRSRCFAVCLQWRQVGQH
jgi:hypothetical protein